MKSNHCKLSKEAIEWVNGELLGDGNIELTCLHSARFRYSSKYLEYIEYVRDTLNSFGIEQVGKIYEYYHKKYDCYTYHYNSRSYSELVSIRKRWYPKGKKIIPKDIVLTPLVCRQHYIGDGSMVCREKRNSHIILCTKGFLISDVKWLMKQLIKLGFKTTRWSDNTIRFSTYSVKDFLKYIGKCPVECYKYKWAY